MKKIILFFALTPLLFACSKDESGVVLPSIDNPTDVIGIGENVTNPKNEQWCKDPQADATLSSLRHISDVLYTMDYTANLHLDELANGNYRTRDAFENAFGEFHFTPEGAEPTIDAAPTACSGFVCRSPQGGLLLGRNFDGAHGPMLLLFNSANGYKYIQCTAPNYNSVLYMGADGLHGDGVLSDGKTSLHRLMRVPLATMDGMNEYGLCFGAYQLPNFEETNSEPNSGEIDPDSLFFGKNNPDHLHQSTGKSAISATLMHNLILSKCKTVKEVEELLKSYDMINIMASLNVHWMVADATGDWAIFEYWKNELHVMREIDQLYVYDLVAGLHMPYEWYSIENYYRNLEAFLAYPNPITPATAYNWQVKMSAKIRVGHMMNFYRPTMTEKEALLCLQEGRYNIEVPNDFTNWSCVYNPKELTLIFALRNDLSKVYTVDLKKVFK